MITIPDNINLVTYSEFCSKACTNIKVIQRYICNPSEFVGAVDAPNEIYGPNSVIPEVYLVMEGDPININICNKNIIFNKTLGFSKLSELLDIINKQTQPRKVNAHILVCLQVFDISNIDANMKNNIDENLFKIISKQNFASKKIEEMSNCNEKTLNIEKKDHVSLSKLSFKDAVEKFMKKTSHGSTVKSSIKNNIELMKNTIISIIVIKDVKTKLYLKFNDNIKLNDVYLLYPTIIHQLNDLFKNHIYKQFRNMFYRLSLPFDYKNKNIDNDLEYNNIKEFMQQISSLIELNSSDENLYNTIRNAIVLQNNNIYNTENSNITINMFYENITDSDNVNIIKKYLFKLLSDIINSSKQPEVPNV